MKTEERRAFIIDVAYYVAIAFVIWVVMKYVIPWSMPFIIGFIIAALLHEFIKKMVARIPKHKKLVAIVTLTFLYLIVGSAIVLLIMKLTAILVAFFSDLPALYASSIEPALETLLGHLNTFVGNFIPNFKLSLSQMDGAIMDFVKSITPELSQKSLSMVLVIPSFIVSALFMIISSYFFTMDYDRIKNFILLQVSDRTREIIFRVKAHGLGTVGKFIKSYGIIMTITFVELSIGFTILGVDNAIAVALIIAVFDILPVLGTGGVMIPWIIIAFVNNDISLAIGLAIIYATVTVIRNIIEPKIVGNQVGAHPLILLMSMFIGVKLLGAGGIFILPITVILLKNMNDEGILSLYKKV